MVATTLHIKNMVCPRCIAAVKVSLEAEQIEYESVKLGEVVLAQSPLMEQVNRFKEQIESQGFELLESQTSILISGIKSLVIDQIHGSAKPLQINFSTLLSTGLKKDYGYLSKLFSSVEGITIERFVLGQKMERVKELLFYNEMTLSEIANTLDYSSVAHLSSQFKKETGMTPTAFKKHRKPGHQALDGANT